MPNVDKPGTTQFCLACENEARGLFVSFKHTCGIEYKWDIPKIRNAALKVLKNE
jgi:hypothetical protein